MSKFINMVGVEGFEPRFSPHTTKGLAAFFTSFLFIKLTRNVHLCTLTWRFVVSTIQKIQRTKGVVYRALIRKKNVKPITRNSPTKKEAMQFSRRIEGSTNVLINPPSYIKQDFNSDYPFPYKLLI